MRRGSWSNAKNLGCYDATVLINENIKHLLDIIIVIATERQNKDKFKYQINRINSNYKENAKPKSMDYCEVTPCIQAFG